MNWDRIQGEWKQLSSHVKEKWAKLTDDDLKTIGAKKDALVGKLQERYGVLRDEAEKQVDEWLAKLPPRHGGVDAKSSHSVDAKASHSVDAKASRPEDAHAPGSPKH
jgi:uncharacterized protein YjbJ (UPF0337 family)